MLSAEAIARMTDAFSNIRLVTGAGAGHPAPLDRPAGFERAAHDCLGLS